MCNFFGTKLKKAQFGNKYEMTSVETLRSNLNKLVIFHSHLMENSNSS